MSRVKENALRSLEKLKDQIPTENYSAIEEGLREIEPLKDRDWELENLWNKFADIPMDPDTECMEEPFLSFKAGTPREEIWRWFDERHSKGVAYLLYGDGTDRTCEMANLFYLNLLCQECESRSCQFNHDCECRFSLVHGRIPRITEADGCIDFEYREGEI